MPTPRILGSINGYCFRPSQFGLAWHTAVANWYKVLKVERKVESVLARVAIPKRLRVRNV